MFIVLKWARAASKRSSTGTRPVCSTSMEAKTLFAMVGESSALAPLDVIVEMPAPAPRSRSVVGARILFCWLERRTVASRFGGLLTILLPHLDTTRSLTTHTVNALYSLHLALVL